jgi:hypothetical protein
VCLQVGEESTAEPESADCGGDPHPFDLGWCVVVKRECTASDGLGVEGSDQEETRGRSQLFVVGGDAAGGVEAAVEAV